MSLLRKALEGDQTAPPTTVAEPATPALNEGNQPNNTAGTVIMTGPLGQAYTQALAIAFAKPDPEAAATDPTKTVAELAMESQANDAIMAAGAITAVTGSDADTIENPEALIYGVSAQKIDEKTVVDIATELSLFEMEKPEEFIVVIDATDMAQQVEAGVDQTQLQQNANEYLTQPINDANMEKAALIPVLESMVVRMGGRVVYSLRGAMEALAEMREEVKAEAAADLTTGDDLHHDDPAAVVVPSVATGTGVVEPMPTPEPIAPAGTEITAPEATASDLGIAVESHGEDEDNLHEKLKQLRDEIEQTSPENVTKTSILGQVVAMLSLESEKAGKKGATKDGKKAEKTSSKLNRAAGLINGVMGQIKDSKVRAELHHAVGIIFSARRDITNAKSSKLSVEGIALEGKSGWAILLEAIGEALDPTTVRNVLGNLTKSKSALETLEGQVRKGTATDEKVIGTCTSTVTAIKYGVDLIEAQQKQLKNAQSQVSKLV